MAALVTILGFFVAVCGISIGAEIPSFKGGMSVSKSESHLRRHLFINYDKLVRPVKNFQNGITVYAGISPLNIQTLDERDQFILMETFFKLRWIDENLTWDPSHYGNISLLTIPSTEVWRPDLSLYTAPDASNMFPVPNTNVLIYNTGTVLWVPMFSIKSRCPVPKTNKKVVTCNIKIGSWTYSGPLLDIQLDKDQVELSDFQDLNHNWKLLGVSQSRENKYYPCCPEPYPSLNFNVTLRKRSELMTVNKGEDTLQEVVMNDW